MTVITRIYHFLASLKLAVILILVLSAVLAAATYYESLYDAKTARHLVYGSPWFALFLFALGVNVTCSAMVRYPWKKHQAGFLVTHLGIIVILVGSLISFVSGFEGTMTLSQGETSNTVVVDEPSFSYQVTDAASGREATFQADQTRTVPAEFRWNPPREGHEVPVPLTNGLAVVFDRYLNSATSSTKYVPGGDKPSPAVHFVLGSGSMKSDQWLAFDTPDHHQVTLGPARIRLRRVETEAALQSALAGPPKGKWPMGSGLLLFELASGVQVVAVEGNVGRIVPLAGTPWRIRIERYLSYAVVEKNKLVNRSPEKENPCVELTVLDEKGEAVESQFLFSRFPQFSRAHNQKKKTDLSIQYTFDDPARDSAVLDLIAGPGDQLHYHITGKTGAHEGRVELNKEIATGWSMGMSLTVTEFIPRSVATQVYEPFQVMRGKEGPPPAVRFRVEGAEKPGPYWLQQGDQVTVAQGNQAMHFRYHLRSQRLGFSIKLVKFEVGFDPGSRQPASFTSQVQVDDNSVPTSFPYTISMNEPLYYRGLSFFQASYSEMPGQAPVSILQVARDPGTPAKYAGSIMLMIGLAIQFFFKSPRRREEERNGEAGEGNREEDEDV